MSLEREEKHLPILIATCFVGNFILGGIGQSFPMNSFGQIFAWQWSALSFMAGTSLYAAKLHTDKWHISSAGFILLSIGQGIIYTMQNSGVSKEAQSLYAGRDHSIFSGHGIPMLCGHLGKLLFSSENLLKEMADFLHSKIKMVREEYPSDLKIKDALQLYFSKYHFVNGGYDLKLFKIKLGPVFIPLPNTKARVDAVKIHDIHHLLTEYPATLKGEAQIGAWEIASGCGKYYAAWILNFGSLLYGIFFFSKAVYAAFIRGRKCKTNLYHNAIYDEQLLNQSVGELRRYIGIDAK